MFKHTSEVAEDLLQNFDRLPEFLDRHVNIYERNGGERRRVYVHPTQCFINTDIAREKVRQLQEDGSNTIELGKCLQIDERQTLYQANAIIDLRVYDCRNENLCDGNDGHFETRSR